MRPMFRKPGTGPVLQPEERATLSLTSFPAKATAVVYGARVKKIRNNHRGTQEASESSGLSIRRIFVIRYPQDSSAGASAGRLSDVTASLWPMRCSISKQHPSSQRRGNRHCRMHPFTMQGLRCTAADARKILPVPVPQPPSTLTLGLINVRGFCSVYVALLWFHMN